jgi:hypothetical protein
MNLFPLILAKCSIYLPPLPSNSTYGVKGAIRLLADLASEFVAVMLARADEDQTVNDRRRITKEFTEEALGHVVEVPMEGRSTMAQIFSTDISRRNWARGLRAPLAWFFEAMRARTR